MRVLVCGDRYWLNSKVIEDQLRRFTGSKPDAHVIHGCANGADTIGGNIAFRMGFEVHEFPAQWKVYGLAAGPIRNQRMLDEGRPDLVLAFHNDIANSKGTKDMIKRARKAGIPVEIITE